MIASLARFFRGLNIALGITTLPPDAAPEKERTFVLIWLGILAFFALWITVLLLWVTS